MRRLAKKNTRIPRRCEETSLFLAKMGTDVDLQLLVKIKLMTGIVEVGLFCGMAKAVYFGNEV